MTDRILYPHRPEYLFNSRFIADPYDRETFHRSVDLLPDEMLTDCGAKLYPFMNLTWGYADTVRSLSVQMRLAETKPLVRRIKELKLSYDRFRQPHIDGKAEAMETQGGEWFEEKFLKDFDRLFVSLDNEARKGNPSEQMRYLMVAVHQTLTLIETVKAYAITYDERMRKLGVVTAPYGFIQDDFLRLHEVMKKFPSACEERFKSLRAISTAILINRLNELEVIRTSKGIGVRSKILKDD